MQTSDSTSTAVDKYETPAKQALNARAQPFPSQKQPKSSTWVNNNVTGGGTAPKSSQKATGYAPSCALAAACNTVLYKGPSYEIE
jgi:hypothetical protein